MREFITKRILYIFIGGVALLSTVDYFVYSTEVEVGLLDIGRFILNNAILMGVVVAAYILLKYLQTRGTSRK